MLPEAIVRAVENAGWLLDPHRRDPIGEGGGGAVYRVYRRDAVENLKQFGGMSPGDTYWQDKVFTLLHNVEAWLDRPGQLHGALKVPHNGQQRAKRELRALAESRHPHLVSLLDFDQSAELPAWFVMDYYPRGSPGPRHYTGATSELLRQGANIADALGHLHVSGRIHRDVKPSNILMRQDGGWVLGDMGIVQEEGASGITEGSLPASRDWVPHWRTTTYRPDERYDLFMVTKTLHYLVIGEKMASVEWLNSHRDSFDVSRRLPHLRGVEALRGFFARHLVHRPEDFGSRDAQEFAEELRALATITDGRREIRLLLSLNEPRSLLTPLGVQLLVPCGTSEVAIRLVQNKPGTFQFALWKEGDYPMKAEAQSDGHRPVEIVFRVSIMKDTWMNIRADGPGTGSGTLYVHGS